MIDFFRNLTDIQLFFLFFLIIMLPPSLCVLFFRDLFFESSFKYRVEEYNVPQQGMILKFLNFRGHTDGYKFPSGKWFDYKLYKDKIVIVAGEAAPRVYNKDFYDRLKVMKEAGVFVTMIAGPVFLIDQNKNSFAIKAAQDGLINMFVASTRNNTHFRTNLYTGELYYEYPHSPNEKHRKSIYFRENRYEVKSYLRMAKKLKKKSKPFLQCVAGQDYLLLSDKQLEDIKEYIDIKGLKNFNDYTVAEIQELMRKQCND